MILFVIEGAAGKCKCVKPLNGDGLSVQMRDRVEKLVAYQICVSRL